MIVPRRIVVAVHNSIACRTVLNAGDEFARLFGVPVLCQVVIDRMSVELCEFPAAFQPRSLASRPGAKARHAMGAALASEMRRIRNEMARFPAMMSSTPPGQADEAAPGDLVVVSADLSEPSFRPAAHSALTLCQPEGAVLIVPERHPSSFGPILILADDAEDRALSVGRKIATALGCKMIVARMNDAHLPGWGDYQIDLPKGQRLTSNMIHTDALRLIVAGEGMLDRLELEIPDSPIHKFRASLLVLGD